jgi:hypothetical protein
MKRPFVLWTIALAITLTSAVYQRLTGPTHPRRGSIEIGNNAISYRLLRSHDSTGDALMNIRVPDRNISGELQFRRFRSNDDWAAVPLLRDGDNLIVIIEQQPPAGKVLYRISLIEESGTRHELTADPVVIRFRGPVPLAVMIAHVTFMFTAMLLSTRTGLEAIAGGKRGYIYSLITAITLLIGGLIFGPVVQKYAFGEFWTGWPFGHDLTDTKTAVAVIFWLVALWKARRPGGGRLWIVIASAVTLLIFIIPHSVLGSELDYTKVYPVKGTV